MDAMKETVLDQARQDQTRRLSNAILRRTIVNVILFSVAYVAGFALFMLTLGNVVSNLVYRLVLYNDRFTD